MASANSMFNFSQSKRKNFGNNKSLAKPMQRVINQRPPAERSPCPIRGAFLIPQFCFWSLMLIKYIDEVLRYSTRFVDES
jgi:hypothetical protein